MTEVLAYDSMQFEESARTIDDNGFLHVTGCAITKEQVAPYFGRELSNRFTHILKKSIKLILRSVDMFD